jgi:phosphoglycerate kinase
MAKQTIDRIPVSGKRVLMRVDFNVPLEEGKITDDRRIREAVPTIRNVLERGGACILMSHLGRPEGKGFEAEFTLKPVAARLGELLGRPVKFPSNDCTDGAAEAAARSARPGEVVLLENVRFAKGEKKGEPEYASKLASYGDVYVNDAFGTAHRKDGSMYAVPRAMGGGAGKPRVAGLLLQKELKFLGETLAHPGRPFVVVLGGAKVSDKLPVIENLLPKTDTIIIGGAMAYTFLAAMGRGVGKSRVEAEMLGEAKKILDAGAARGMPILLPHDHVCSTVFAADAGDVRVFEEHIGDGYMGLDIGPKSRLAFGEAVLKARTVVWNGPMGVFEWPPFRVGTQQVAQAIVDATAKGATSIVGGGDSAAAAEEFGLADKFSHVSTGGGASLEMLAGKPFETVELLDNA